MDSQFACSEGALETAWAPAYMLGLSFLGACCAVRRREDKEVGFLQAVSDFRGDPCEDLTALLLGPALEIPGDVLDLLFFWQLQGLKDHNTIEKGSRPVLFCCRACLCSCRFLEASKSLACEHIPGSKAETTMMLSTIRNALG